jgi:hypothetical protein
MFFGSDRCEWLTPKNFFEIGYLKTTELPLSAADANSTTAALKIGKIVDYKDNSELEMKLGSGFGVGLLTRPVSLLGGLATDVQLRTAQLGTAHGREDIPVTRGFPVTIQCPLTGAEAIFEGAADITGAGTVLQAIDHLVVKTGTGAIGAGTAINTLLSVLNGAWRIAQTGDFVLAVLRQANLTPKNVGEIRIRVRFISPYKI